MFERDFIAQVQVAQRSDHVMPCERAFHRGSSQRRLAEPVCSPRAKPREQVFVNTITIHYEHVLEAMNENIPFLTACCKSVCE